MTSNSITRFGTDGRWFTEMATACCLTVSRNVLMWSAMNSHTGHAIYRWVERSRTIRRVNESMSDVFGSLVKQMAAGQTADKADWLIGAGLLMPSVSGVALRSMKDPGTAYNDPQLGQDPQPANMANYLDTTDDNGGVHINSGIPNHAFYLTATRIGGYAWEKAGRIWYVTLTTRLQADSDFQAAADLTFAVAGEVYGSGSAEQQAVRGGWDEVGITINPTFAKKLARPAKTAA